MTSPDFSINGGATGVKASVTAGSTVVCELDSTDGVTSTTWSVIRTDETTVAATWEATFVQTGAVGEHVEFTALGVGTACIVQAEINSGTVAGQITSESRATAKVFVPTAEGLELLTNGELAGDALEASATHGAVDPLNACIRAAGGALSDYKPSVKVATTAALAAYTRAGNAIRADANGWIGGIDSVLTVAAGDLVLLKDGASGVDNGVYEMDHIGDGSNPFQMTRVWWMDESAEVTASCLIPVETGATYGDRVMMLTTNNPIVINTTSLSFSVYGGHWSRTAAVIHPTLTADTVAIGASAMLGTEKLRVAGAIAATGQVAVSGAVGDQGGYFYGDDYVGVCLESYKGAAWPHALLNMWGGRGTKAAPSQLLSGDYPGTISFRGYTSGGSFLGCAQIDAFALENFTGAAVGTRLIFATAAVGAAATATRLTLDNTSAAFSVPITVNTHPVDGYTLTAVKTGAYNAVICDLVRVDPSGGGFAVTLPTAVGMAERGITVKNTTNSVNAVTFNTTGGQTIDGMASGVDSIAAAYATVTFISDGANWMRFPAA